MKLYAVRNTKTGEYVTFSILTMYDECEYTYRHFDYNDSDIYFQDYEINLDCFINFSLSSRLFANAKCGYLEVVEVNLP